MQFATYILLTCPARDKNLVEKLWITQGDGLFNLWGIADWSGHHLAQVTFCQLRLLGGASPSGDEQAWRDAGISGLKVGFNNMLGCREPLLAVVAAAGSVSGASDQGKDLLVELPCPKPSGDVEFDSRVSGDFCMSPYPNVPWKNDWMTNPGRMQSIDGRPYFYQDAGDNFFNGNPFSFDGSLSDVRNPGQDFLHAYWLARLTGTLGPKD